MNKIKQLAGQTAIYGVSSILARVLNYLLVPLHTYIFVATDQYGIIGEMYAYVAFLVVILTYGMETAFFRYSELENDRNSVFTTTFISLLVSSSVFVTLAIIFSQPIADMLRYPNNSEYVVWFAMIVSLDAVTAAPFAKLRAEKRAKRFAFIRIANIAVYIILNLFFLVLCPYLHENNILPGIVDVIYRGEVGVGYVFISNLIASIVQFILLLPEMVNMKSRFDPALWRKMIVYALPLLIFGLAGIVNETIDRILIKYLLPEDMAMSQVGIYSACYKISIIIYMFIQAFRYAAEPFFFAQAKEQDAKTVYADVMKYMIIIVSFIFLATLLYLPVIQYFISENYREGLKIVPILLMAYVFVGVSYNLSIWYKLTNQTKFGAYLAISGAIITLIMNFWLIPVIGYMGSAWATFTCYLLMMIASYMLGQKYYPVKYDLKNIFLYLVLALALYFLSTFTATDSMTITLLINTAILLVFVIIVYKREDLRGLILRK